MLRALFRLLSLQVLLTLVVVRGDFFHYYKLKKFITAVAFARALGRKPTLLPVPIPIPIPISQNEVIRLPSNSAKSFVSLTGSPKYGSGYSSGGSSYTGSTSFGYPLPGSFDSTSSIGGMGGNNVIYLDGNDIMDGGHGDFDASPNIIRVVARKPRRYFRRRPSRVYLAGGGRTMRNSDYLDVKRPIATHTISKKTPKRKKPIPVGEKFRLP